MCVRQGRYVHRKRYEGLNHARFLTESCFQRRPFLNRDRTRHWFIDAVSRAATKHQFELWARVIMPEHVHLLLFPEPGGSTISDILTSVKQSVSVRAVAWVKQHAPASLRHMADPRRNGVIIHRFWQPGGGYDRNLWSPKHIWKTIDYIHTNPVARGLCARPEDWPWSSAAWYADRSTATPIPLNLSRLPAQTW